MLGSDRLIRHKHTDEQTHACDTSRRVHSHNVTLVQWRKLFHLLWAPIKIQLPIICFLGVSQQLLRQPTSTWNKPQLFFFCLRTVIMGSNWPIGQETRKYREVNSTLPFHVDLNYLSAVAWIGVPLLLSRFNAWRNGCAFNLFEQCGVQRRSFSW